MKIFVDLNSIHQTGAIVTRQVLYSQDRYFNTSLHDQFL